MAEQFSVPDKDFESGLLRPRFGQPGKVQMLDTSRIMDEASKTMPGNAENPPEQSPPEQNPDDEKHRREHEEHNQEVRRQLQEMKMRYLHPPEPDYIDVKSGHNYYKSIPEFTHSSEAMLKLSLKAEKDGQYPEAVKRLNGVLGIDHQYENIAGGRYVACMAKHYSVLARLQRRMGQDCEADNTVASMKNYGKISKKVYSHKLDMSKLKRESDPKKYDKNDAPCKPVPETNPELKPEQNPE